MDSKTDQLKHKFTALVKNVFKRVSPDKETEIHEHLLIFPAKSEFDYPSVIPVKSTKKLAEAGETITVECTIQGSSFMATRGDKKVRIYKSELWAV